MRLACALLFLGLWALASALIYSHWDSTRQERLDENTRALAMTYRSSINMYRLNTELLFKDVIQRPDVIETFAAGVFGDEKTASRERGKLYRLLAPTYDHLKAQGVNQLHFHTADGRSYLRFHAPERFGDPLFDARPSVLLANSQKHMTFGFETGRLNSGFRFVFPLFKGNQHLGSVETGITFRAISEAMAEVDPGREFLLILRKEGVFANLFEDQRVLYGPSPLHDSFLVEDPQLRLPVSPPPLSVAAQDINARLKRTHRIEQELAAGQAFSLAVATAEGDWAVAFEPINNLLGKNTAYIIAYTRAPFLADLRRDLILQLLLAFLTLGGLFWATLRLVQSHASLRREKQHLQLITDTITDGLCVMDAQGHILQTNPAFTAILGYREEEIIGKIGHSLLHVHEDGTHMPVKACPVMAALAKGEAYAGEQIFRKKNGQLITVELTCLPFSKEDPLGSSLTAFRDVTERKLVETQLRENDRVKSEFIATASHELRTPLAVIQGYAELLRENDALSPEQIKHFETIIYDRAVALEKIVSDLLDISRIESGRPLCLDLTQVDIVAEIRQVLAHFRKEASHHRFAVDFPEESCLLAADRFKLIQVLENLLNNAVKFSPMGSTINVSGKLLDRVFQVTVADEGLGIPAEKQKHIFDKFFRVDASNTALPGFGLGLYLVKRIVEAHGGQIRVESAVGRGTKFFFTLPTP